MERQKVREIEAEHVLLILREISTNPQTTQRDLSSRLGVSLGKINFLIKAMIEKGFVKAENFKNSNHKMGYLYYLTPSGIEEKSRITYRFLKRKMDEYEKLEEEIQQLKHEVSAENTHKIL